MADNELQISLELRNLFSDELQRIMGQLDQLEAKLRDATDGTSDASARDIERLSAEIRSAETDSRTLTRAIGTLDDHIDELGDEAEQTSRQMDGMGRSSVKSESGFSKMSKTVGKATLVFAAVTAAVIGTTKAITAITKATGEYQTSLTKSRVVFGDQLPQMRKWAKAHREAFGVSTQDVINYGGSIQDLLVPMGFQRDQASEMTTGLLGIVPALQAVDEQHRSTGEITRILTAALMGEREALNGLGLDIKQKQLDAHVKLLDSQGKLVGMTEQQQQAYATLDMITRQSADAQTSFAKGTGGVTQSMNKMKSGAAEFRDQGLRLLLETWERFSRALSRSGVLDSLASGFRKLSRWVKQNSDGIISWLLNFASTVVRAGGWALKFGTWGLMSFRNVAGAISTMLQVAALINPAMRGAADKASSFVAALDGAIKVQQDASESAFTAADALHQEADAAGRAQRNAETLRSALRGLNREQRKQARKTMNEYQDSWSSWRPPGDTRAPWGGPVLGAAGLAAAHAHYASGLGMRVTSGVRGWGLGSSRSDHLTGRAMDVKGPFTGAYAARVRAAGGYAAMHGVGADRHLHVAPRGMPEAVPAGGDTYHVEAHFHGSEPKMFDVRSAVSSGIRDAQRRRRERGGA